MKIPDWIYWGEEHAASVTEKRKIFNINTAATIAYFSIGFYSIL